MSILGPSGCGKTTLLRACCGLEPLVNGSRHLAEKALPENVILPEITLLFQQPVLYPHLNVSQNLALGAARRSSKAEVNRKVEAVLNAVGLDGFQARGTCLLYTSDAADD